MQLSQSIHPTGLQIWKKEKNRFGGNLPIPNRTSNFQKAIAFLDDKVWLHAFAWEYANPSALPY
jgi:hypothetical protein